MKKLNNLLCGLVIGDGTITKSGKRLQINHSLKQIEYLKYKITLLNKYGINPELQLYNNNGYEGCRIGFTNQNCKFVRKWLYREGYKVIKKEFLLKLSDLEIAIWYMDDGSLYRKKGTTGKSGDSYELTIASYCKTEKEAEDLIEFFRIRYNVTFTIKRNKGRFSIRCGKKSAIVFLNSIDKYIPDCMSYKTFRN